MFAVGAFIGLILINLLSDIKGRKPSLILAVAIANLSGVCAFLGASYDSLALLLLAQFFGGFGAYSLIPVIYALLSDFCSDKLRQQGVVYVNSAMGVATLTLGLMYVFHTNWSIFLLYGIIIPLFFISCAIVYHLK